MYISSHSFLLAARGLDLAPGRGEQDHGVCREEEIGNLLDTHDLICTLDPWPVHSSGDDAGAHHGTRQRAESKIRGGSRSKHMAFSLGYLPGWVDRPHDCVPLPTSSFRSTEWTEGQESS